MESENTQKKKGKEKRKSSRGQNGKTSEGVFNRSSKHQNSSKIWLENGSNTLNKLHNLRTSSQKHSAKFYTPNPEKLYNPGME